MNAIVAAAFGTMTQPTGDVCGTDANLDFYFKASPVICLIDALLVLYRAGKYLYYRRVHNDSKRQALQRLYYFRFQYKLERGPNTRHGDFEEFWRNWFARWLVFFWQIWSILPILSSKGDLWTNLLIGVYLFHFVVMEMLCLTPHLFCRFTNYWFPPVQEEEKKHPDANDEPPWRSSGYLSLPTFSICTAVVFVLNGLGIAIRDAINPSKHIFSEALRWIIIDITAEIGFMMLTFFWLSKPIRLHGSHGRWKTSVFGSLFSFAICVVFIIFPHSLPKWAELFVGSIFATAFIFDYVFKIATIIAFIKERLRYRTDLSTDRRIKKWLESFAGFTF